MFNYLWKLADWYPSDGVESHKLKVFSCFSCGGGSTMGYKLAGYDVIWCNEIDPKMMACYIENHHPKFSYLEDIRLFKTRDDLPEELYNLDILDWSPPCSSFSMAGNREEDRGKEKKFREGQELQTLDDLFFDFIDLAKKLQPKVVIAENVEGLLLWEARQYVQRIYKEFDEAWYYLDHYLLNSSTMWVPQSRSRVFFIGVRKDLKDMIASKDMFTQWPKLRLEFKEAPITFDKIFEDYEDRPLSETTRRLWDNRIVSDTWLQNVSARLDNKPNNRFSYNFIKRGNVLWTILANDRTILYEYPRHPNKTEYCLWGSYPLDYNFLSCKPHYLIGMSVPPVMLAHVANQIYLQLFKPNAKM